MTRDDGLDLQACRRFGEAAAQNPAHRGRAFEDIEAELQKEWAEDVISRHGDWAAARPHAREGFLRAPINRGGA